VPYFIGLYVEEINVLPGTRQKAKRLVQGRGRRQEARSGPCRVFLHGTLDRFGKHAAGIGGGGGVASLIISGRGGGMARERCRDSIG